MRRLTGVFTLIVLLAGLTQVQGSITTYSSRSDWETAVGGSGSYWEETFNEFTADQSFVATAVDVGEFSLKQNTNTAVTAAGVQWNCIDAFDPNLRYPSAYPSFDGSTYALMLVDYGSQTTRAGEITVAMTFDTPVWAWGADFNMGETTASLGELVALVALGDGGTVTINVPATTDALFFGFTSDQAITSITFRAQRYVGSSTVEGFALDNVVGAPVPEPATAVIWALLAGLGITAAWWRRGR